jgi:acetyl-CoA carboxylase biotin carboxyl carrier protein
MTSEHEDPVDHQPATRTDASDQDLVEPVAVGPGDPVARAVRRQPRDGAADPADASLLELIDRLAAVLEKSELGELEVGVGGTTIILRSPAAIERSAMAAPGAAETIVAEPVAAPGAPAGAAGQAGPAAAAAGGPARPSVKAPLTGIFYGAPSPGAMPYVAVGDHVSVGQIIGLIEAMKLFNEIKSDIAGRVSRICAESGQLVKARQPLIEVDRA